RKIHGIGSCKSAEKLRNEFASVIQNKKTPKVIKSLILKKQCPVCLKDAVELSRVDFGGEVMITLKCGHFTTEDKINIKDNIYSLLSEHGKTLMPFQVEGVKFAENSNIRCLIGDEQG